MESTLKTVKICKLCQPILGHLFHDYVVVFFIVPISIFPEKGLHCKYKGPVQRSLKPQFLQSPQFRARGLPPNCIHTAWNCFICFIVGQFVPAYSEKSYFYKRVLIGLLLRKSTNRQALNWSGRSGNWALWLLPQVSQLFSHKTTESFADPRILNVLYQYCSLHVFPKSISKKNILEQLNSKDII